MNSSKVAVRGATLLVVVPSRGWSGFTSAADLLAVRESMNVCLTSGLTIRMDASTTFCGHVPITPFLGSRTLEAASTCDRPREQVLADNSFRVDRFGQHYRVSRYLSGETSHNRTWGESARVHLMARSSGIDDQSACSGRHVGALFMIDRTYMTKCALNFLSGCS